MWKPCVSLMAVSSFVRSVSSDLYSGSSRWLKHVCADGNLPSSEPCREITSLSPLRPLMGTLSLPVQKMRNLRLVSSSIACTTSQNALRGDAHACAARGISTGRAACSARGVAGRT